LLVLLRNFVAVFVVVGGLHIWFYGIDGQGNVLRFDTRPINSRKNALFAFGYQTWDNMFYTLAFGVPIASAWEIFIRYQFANEWGTTVSFSENPIWFLLLFPLLTLYQGVHFYFIHRLLHWPPLYKRVHSIHHRNINVGPWSGLSMHPLEHFLYFSTLLIFLVFPAHPMHILFLLHWQLLGAPSGHSGYEAVFAKDKARLLIGGFFHQLHHRYFECNYGSPEFPLDKWFGTFHDGTEEMTAKTRERTRNMRAQQ
jgi:sterol desaturase/sphingolipid hydroxylase (fatty acid hydroxylase superfamily)